ncbi:MAG: DUF4145 domain-containing protein [Rhodospirillales bacterium]|nr:DUF4145 domain-containing protein [Rhodospirillales bacterium]
MTHTDNKIDNLLCGLRTDTLATAFDIKSYINLRDNITESVPDHIPPEIQAIFKEAATCLATQCWNAAGAMFRKCVDRSTYQMLPDENENVVGLDKNTRQNLKRRLVWLFNNRPDLKHCEELAECIREDGNDSVHAGSLNEKEAQDLLDFTKVLLEHLYTRPKSIELAKERRDSRRQQKN